MKKKNVLILTALVLCLSLLLCGCTSAKDPTVKVGKDEIPTLYAAVGKRSISGTSKGFENDVNYVTLTYKSGEVSEADILSYLNVLTGDGFLYTKDSSLENDVLSLQLGKESAEDCKIILVDIEYPKLGSTVISYRTGTGEITSY